MHKEHLEKLIDFIADLSTLPGNQWFVDKLQLRLNFKGNLNTSNSKINEIYEYCVNRIIKEQAEKFYLDFNGIEIKNVLVQDFIRMEKFRRNDNFEDFCLAIFQQIEAIVNHLCTPELHQKFLNQFELVTHKAKNKESQKYEDQKLWQLIFFPSLNREDLYKKANKRVIEWDFMEKYKLILYFYYFNQTIHNYFDFQSKYFIANELYQLRNTNHRGGASTEKQKITVEKVKQNSHKYYFKFLGYFEEFVSRINNHIPTA
jgi:hypothetical protein